MNKKKKKLDLSQETHLPFDDKVSLVWGLLPLRIKVRGRQEKKKKSPKGIGRKKMGRFFGGSESWSPTKKLKMI